MASRCHSAAMPPMPIPRPRGRAAALPCAAASPFGPPPPPPPPTSGVFFAGPPPTDVQWMKPHRRGDRTPAEAHMMSQIRLDMPKAGGVPPSHPRQRCPATTRWLSRGDAVPTADSRWSTDWRSGGKGGVHRLSFTAPHVYRC